MKKKIVLLLVLMTVAVLVLGACTAKGENILKTGDDNAFAYENLKALTNDWTLKTEEKNTTDSVFSVTDNALAINTTSAGWAQATQQVELQSNSYYYLEYTYTANKFSTFDGGFEGLFVSFIEDDDFNKGVNRIEHRLTSTTKDTGSFYFHTNGSVKKATLAINVGTKDYPVSVNSVTIYNIKLVKVSKSEVKAAETACLEFTSDHYGDVGVKNITWVVMGAVAIALLGYAAYVLYQRNMSFNGVYNNKLLTKLSDSKYMGVLLVGGITFLIRLLIDLLTTCLAGSKAYMQLGYQVEGYASQALFIAQYGTVNLGTSLARFCNGNGYTYMAVGSNPILLYLLSIAGLLGRLMEIIGNACNNAISPYLATIFFIKLFASLADVATAVFIYIMVKKNSGNVGATIIGTLFAVLPVTFAFSGLWGYVESITVFLIVLTVYFMLKNNYYGVAISYFVAFLFSWTALIFVPIVIFYSIQQAINRREVRIPMICAVVIGFALFYVLNLPFDINQIKSGTAFACVVKYWNMVAKNLTYTINAFNFQAILGNNMSSVSTESLIVSVIFVVFMLALVAFGYFKFKNRMNLLLLATAFINMVFMFANNMTPYVMAMNLVLMLIYAIMNKEKRVYFAFVAFAVLTFVNASVGELLYEYTATANYSISYETATIYVFSAFNLVMTLYYLFITYDIIVTKKVRKIQPMTLTYIGWWKNLFLRIKKAYYKLRIKTAKQ